MTERGGVSLCLHTMIEELESAWLTLYVVHLGTSCYDCKGCILPCLHNMIGELESALLSLYVVHLGTSSWD